MSTHGKKRELCFKIGDLVFCVILASVSLDLASLRGVKGHTGGI